MIEKITLVAQDNDLFEAWCQSFEAIDSVKPKLGDIFDVEADAMVSPANSFGIMDGGLDLLIRDKVGFDTEKRLQDKIVDEYHGELPVGSALIVPTDKAQWKYLISAPTMRVPEDVSHSINAYLAFRAVLLATFEFNRQSDEPIKTIVCPGLATGIGCMPARKCSAQMRIAYNYMSRPPRIPSYQEIHEVHRKLRIVP